jgi:radical SAM superfamily enzyme with C-terminal helix-hairpin-helix motif
MCHRTNVRVARAYPGTPLAALGERERGPSAEHFETWKADLDAVWDLPMKQRVYPTGLQVPGLHAFFVNEAGTWFRRLGSYSIQIVEPQAAVPLYTTADLTVTGHASRWVYGERHGL